MKRVVLPIMLIAALLLLMPLAVAAEEPTDSADLTMAVKAAWGLRLRADPGLSSRTRFVLDCGEQVTATEGLDGSIIKNGLEWVQVSVTRDERVTTGYVALKYLTEDLTPSCYLWAPGPCQGPGGRPGGRPGGPVTGSRRVLAALAAPRSPDIDLRQFRRLQLCGAERKDEGPRFRWPLAVLALVCRRPAADDLERYGAQRLSGRTGTPRAAEA